MNALEEFDLKDSEEISKPEFTVNDLGSATWVMRKLRALDSKDADTNATADEQIAAINEWRNKQLAANNDNRAYFHGFLWTYLDKLREEDPKARIETPYGTVSTRKTPASVEWSDKDVLASLEEQKLDSLIRVKKEPDKKAIKKEFSFVNGRYINSDGQELKGAAEKPARTNLVVKTDVPTP